MSRNVTASALDNLAARHQHKYKVLWQS